MQIFCEYCGSTLMKSYDNVNVSNYGANLHENLVYFIRQQCLRLRKTFK